jgi:ParB family chromosome partitioning protein
MIVDSKTNPRGKDFDNQAFDELAASVKEKGVLVPILVRKISGADNVEKYEVIAGARRLRAARVTGQLSIPCQVAVMNDIEAREAQIIENLQRDDIPPLAEAEAFRQLAIKSKFTLTDISMKLGKSEQYVRDRISLTALIPKAQEALTNGKIGLGIAVLISRLEDVKMQKLALEETLQGWRGNDTIEGLRSWIQENLYKDLANTPWANDEELEKAVGVCEQCPAGKDNLFGKTAGGRCPDPACYPRKMAAYIAIKLRDYPEAKKVTRSYGKSHDDVISQSACSFIDDKDDECENKIKAIIVEGEGLGKFQWICVAPDCEKHKTNSFIGRKLSPEEKAEKKAEREKEAKKLEKQNEDILKALEKVKFPFKDEAHLDLLVKMIFGRFGFSYMQPVAARHGIKAIVKKNDYGTSRDLDTPMKKWVEEGGNERKMQFIFEMALQSGGSDAMMKEIKKL